MKFQMLIGLPGSGKSTFAKSLSGVHLSSDDLRDDFKKVNIWDEMHELTELALQENRDVVFDATNLVPENRAKVLDIAKRYGAETIAYIFDTPFEECLRRNKLRRPERIVPESAIHRMAKTYVPSTEDEFDTIIHV